MKKLKIEKIRPTFIISTFKTDIIKVALLFLISYFFIAKTSLANNWRSFSSSYLALVLDKNGNKKHVSNTFNITLDMKCYRIIPSYIYDPMSPNTSLTQQPPWLKQGYLICQNLGGSAIPIGKENFCLKTKWLVKEANLKHSKI